MGYHVIFNNEDKFETTYAETTDELYDLNLNKDSIIYQGEKEWKPQKIAESEYVKYTEPNNIAGYKAERMFFNLAFNKYILEPIEQDIESKERYNVFAKEKLSKENYSYIKRGDFLIRDILNLEVDVKCRKFDDQDKFSINHYEIENFKRMQVISKVPIIYAVFERSGNAPLEDRLFTISNFKILQLIESGDLIKLSSKDGGYYKISSGKHCWHGLGAIEHFKKKMKLIIDD